LVVCAWFVTLAFLGKTVQPSGVHGGDYERHIDFPGEFKIYAQ